MSQADEYLRHRDPGKALVRLPEGQGTGAWADLRPAVRWLQRRRPVFLGAILLVMAQVAWRAQFLGGMFFYRQDFFNLDFAISSRFNWHYLTYVGTGHLMIAERAIIWVLARISLYNWALASAVSLAFLAAAGLAAFRALRLLFGERPAILAPLAVYLLSPLGVASLGWWTVALESLPLQLAMLMALCSHVHYVRTRRRRHAVAACLWVIFGLLASAKGLVVPALLFMVTSAYLPGRTSWFSGARRALIRYWKVWVTCATVLAGYAIVLATSLRTSTSHPRVPALSAVATFSWGLLRKSLVPGVLGGPWQWWQVPGRAYALAAPPAELIWVALIIAVGVVGLSIARRRISWRAWMIAAVWLLLADLLPVIISSLNWYPLLLSLDTRYVADAVPVLMICVSLVYLPVVGDFGAEASPRAFAWTHAPQRDGAGNVLRSAAVGLLAVLVVGSIWSARSYESVTTGQPAASYLASASRAVAEARRGTPVLDRPVPDQLKDAANDVRAVIGPIRPGKLRWIETPRGTIDRLRMFGPQGQLNPAWVYGASTGRPKAPRSCWPQRHGRIVLTFWHAPPTLSTVLRVGYIWGSTTPGTIMVTYGTTTRELTVRPGLHSAYLAVTGSADALVVSGLGGRRICIGDAEAGLLQPVLSSQEQP